MVRSGRIHRLVKEAGAFGTRTGPVALDWEAIVRRQHAIVTELQPPPAAFEKAGARVYLGEARFVDAHTVQADGGRIQGEKIVVAAGSEPVVPPVDGRELAITSDDVLFLPRFPESLVLVGGGVIGLEMAGAFSDLGARVTVLAREAEILPALDADVAAYIRTILESRGVAFHLGAAVERFSGARGAVTTHFTKGGSRPWVSPSRVAPGSSSPICSAGRRAGRCDPSATSTSPCIWTRRRTSWRAGSRPSGLSPSISARTKSIWSF